MVRSQPVVAAGRRQARSKVLRIRREGHQPWGGRYRCHNQGEDDDGGAVDH
jgi:hypothetical protein